ncbi:hypothetical protein WA1_50845 [Scytonema hofmannii PCC 7110]|uniref:Uncharacterized protein n=1 Tax=Scytonema hofmannii PCC 7110 TaxID=128403 RepID=A0A139WQ25_9CYAN|nr:hypothetical protein [Scytonema hofmannii]KYC34530.1 hypothetical protein WA1_50845 [Scytonema hofmannii PCC 7110]
MPRKKDLAESVMLTVIRKKSTLEGKVLEYLKESEEGGSDLAMAAIMLRHKPYYLRKVGVPQEELRSCVLDAIADLEAEIVKLKRAFGMEGLAQVVLVQPYNGVPSISASLATANLVPPKESFFGSNESDSVELPTANEVSVSVELEEEEDLDDDDGFFDDDEDDPIAKAEIEVDAGFRLE